MLISVRRISTRRFNSRVVMFWTSLNSFLYIELLTNLKKLFLFFFLYETFAYHFFHWSTPVDSVLCDKIWDISSNDNILIKKTQRKTRIISHKSEGLRPFRKLWVKDFVHGINKLISLLGSRIFLCTNLFINWIQLFFLLTYLNTLLCNRFWMNVFLTS